MVARPRVARQARALIDCYAKTRDRVPKAPFAITPGRGHREPRSADRSDDMKGRNYLLAGGLAAALFGLAAASGALGSGVPVVAGGLLIFAGAGAALVGWFIKQGRRP